jgi:hypothetical protein
LLPEGGSAFVVPPAAFVAPEFGKGFRVQLGGIGVCLLHPGGLSEDIIAIGLPVLLLGFVVFPAKLSIFGEAGLCSLVTVNAGIVPVAFPVALLVGGSAFVVPVGTLVMLPRGGVTSLLTVMMWKEAIRCLVRRSAGHLGVQGHKEDMR